MGSRLTPSPFRILGGLLLAAAVSVLSCHSTSGASPDDGTPEAGSGGTDLDVTQQDDPDAADESQGPSGSGGGSRDAGGGGQQGADSKAPDSDASAGQEPGPGELGGVCNAGDQCTQGSCFDLASGRAKRCSTECKSNYECPESLRCEAVSQDSMFCLFGPRGTASTGQPCGSGQKGLGCASGLCVDADPQEAISVDTCTDVCKSSTDCVVPFPICVGGVDLCLPILSGDLGGLCTFEGKCVQGDCLEVGGADKRCTRTCSAGDDCGQPYLQCTRTGNAWYCLMKS